DPMGVYTLNFTPATPGPTTIASVVVDWGDGFIDTFVGLPAAVSHRYPAIDDIYGVKVSLTSVTGASAGQQLLTANPEFARPSQGFVAKLYHDAFGRDVDPAGLAHWSAMLEAGTTPLQVASAITSSAEYRAKVVRDLYRQFLRREADPSGLQTGM